MTAVHCVRNLGVAQSIVAARKAMYALSLRWLIYDVSQSGHDRLFMSAELPMELLDWSIDRA